MTLTPGQPVVELEGIQKYYGQGASLVRALDGIDLVIRAGEFTSIMGASGSGKSTCMNIIGCLDVPSGGQYRFCGTQVGQLTRNQRALLRRHFIGFVFQGFNLLARTSALENVELPLVYRRIPRVARRARALQALELVGLSDRASHTSAELSGGQQQRVAIARALVSDPALLLADEPTGNLDTARSQEIMGLLQALNRERGLTIVMVTHEADIAQYSRRKVLFRDGRIVEESNR
jgi:putative ABC transport system ATP-binding protein